MKNFSMCGVCGIVDELEDGESWMHVHAYPDFKFALHACRSCAGHLARLHESTPHSAPTIAVALQMVHSTEVLVDDPIAAATAILDDWSKDKDSAAKRARFGVIEGGKLPEK